MTQASTAIIDDTGTTTPDIRSEIGTIGPNAAIQLLAALRDARLDQLAEQVFIAAGVAEWLVHPPITMVDQRRVARLHRAVRDTVPRDQARRLLGAAGRLTADYILANRIPRPAQMVLKLLPASLAGRLLVAAIRAHAWTFAGSARFTAQAGAPTVFTLTGNPLCTSELASSPICCWHAAVFQRLFEVLVSHRSRVVETACEASGDRCCRFEIDLQGAPRSPPANHGATPGALG
jgi:divinyl protochlorophyllide a 8-vinyl-reductase